MGDKIVKSKNLCCQPVVFPSLSLLSGIESLSGLHDLKRHDKITGLNDLNSLFGLKKSKSAFWVISMPSGTSAASLTSTASMTSVASMTSTASFHIKNFQHDVAINLATKWPILDSLCGMDHQKYSILLISGTLSVGGCGGHECYFQPNLRVISQISTSQKCTDFVFMT